jgi:hypothetical protein
VIGRAMRAWLVKGSMAELIREALCRMSVARGSSKDSLFDSFKNYFTHSVPYSDVHVCSDLQT